VAHSGGYESPYQRHSWRPRGYELRNLVPRTSLAPKFACTSRQTAVPNPLQAPLPHSVSFPGVFLLMLWWPFSGTRAPLAKLSIPLPSEPNQPTRSPQVSPPGECFCSKAAGLIAGPIAKHCPGLEPMRPPRFWWPGWLRTKLCWPLPPSL